MTSVAADYTNQIHIDAPPEKVLDVLTTAARFASWWSPAAGSAVEGGELRITFDNIEDPLIMDVRQASPSIVRWAVTSCSFLPDWVGTTPAFTLSESGTGGCDLRFRHEGLRPDLECYDMCRAGWDQYLPSLRHYIETRTGNPYSGPR
jgi:uncharacterized protein YndB with AHSA1/START domain